jgi:hypothetical protein
MVGSAALAAQGVGDDAAPTPATTVRRPDHRPVLKRNRGADDRIRTGDLLITNGRERWFACLRPHAIDCAGLLQAIV